MANRENIYSRETITQAMEYWLDEQNYDLPEPDTYARPSETLPSFIRNSIGKREVEAETPILTIFLGLHHPNYVLDEFKSLSPKKLKNSYLLGLKLTPVLHEDAGVLIARPRDALNDSYFNLSAMRRVYKAGLVDRAQKDALQWITDHKEVLAGFVDSIFRDAKQHYKEGFKPEELVAVLNNLNRELFDSYFPSAKSRAYMNQQMSHTGMLEEDGKKLAWSFFFSTGEDKNAQMGPFFASDLDRCMRLASSSEHNLSAPLKAYLMGNKNQLNIPVENFSALLNTFNQTPNILSSAVWPSNPEHGLTMLQELAVRAFLDNSDGVRPIVAVNGPPGTGKTTMLKEVIAHTFAQRTKLLMNAKESLAKILQSPDAHFDDVMRHSMVVASSNNTAVENISKELPQAKGLFEDYRHKISHFTELAKEGDWGLFCSVLGNSSNRSNFLAQLVSIKEHFSGHEADYLEFTERVGDTVKRIKLVKQQIDETESYTEALDRFARWLLSLDSKELHYITQLFKLLPCSDSERYGIGFLELLNHPNVVVAKAYEACDLLDHIEKSFGISLLQHESGKAKGIMICLLDVVATLLTSKINYEDYLSLSWKLAFEELKAAETGRFFAIGENKTGEEVSKKSILETIHCSDINDARAKLFMACLRLNEASLLCAGDEVIAGLEKAEKVMSGDTADLNRSDIKQAWMTIFLFFPVASTTLSSVERLFETLEDKESLGLAMIDESGQAVKSHCVGLLQRCRQAMIVGDPIQVEPVVKGVKDIDKELAGQHLHERFIQNFMVSSGSTQSTADQAGDFYSMIGSRKVGLPLLVHRRCSDPMFSLANRIAYEGLMINAQKTETDKYLPSVWIDTEDTINATGAQIQGYYNTVEADIAMQLIELIVNFNTEVAHEGIFIITPFTSTKYAIENAFKALIKTSAVKWLKHALPAVERAQYERTGDFKAFNTFTDNHIGTVHTFQGKEAGTVIMCMGACKAGGKASGVKWVNSSPNILNVALTRAKKQFFFVGAIKDWHYGTYSKVIADKKGPIKVHYSASKFVNDCHKKELIKTHSLIEPVQSTPPTVEVDSPQNNAESVEPIISEELMETNETSAVVDINVLNDVLEFTSCPRSIMSALEPIIEALKNALSAHAKARNEMQTARALKKIFPDGNPSQDQISSIGTLVSSGCNSVTYRLGHLHLNAFGVPHKPQPIKNHIFIRDRTAIDFIVELTKVISLSANGSEITLEAEVLSNFDLKPETISAIDSHAIEAILQRSGINSHFRGTAPLMRSRIFLTFKQPKRRKDRKDRERA